MVKESLSQLQRNGIAINELFFDYNENIVHVGAKLGLNHALHLLAYVIGDFNTTRQLGTHRESRNGN
jgi:hypothetical protein